MIGANSEYSEISMDVVTKIRKLRGEIEKQARKRIFLFLIDLYSLNPQDKRIQELLGLYDEILITILIFLTNLVADNLHIDLTENCDLPRASLEAGI